MKKMITMLLAILMAGAFATDWFPTGAERVTDHANMSLASKDTAYYTYSGASAYIYSGVKQRATYVNVEDFGLSYPVNFGGVQSYLNDIGKTSSYKIYDRDGVTVLWTSDDFVTTIAGWEIVQPTAPLILNDDFYIVHIPLTEADGKGYPRIIYDAGTGVYGHSYLGYPGAWGAGIGVYNLRMAIGLEQYTGIDISGPSVRTIYGTEAFMDYDANLVMAMTDEGSITTVTGAYSVDAGVTWLNFDITPAKANYYEYAGTIPGQVDGTEGTAVIFVYDDLGNYTESTPFSLSWSIDNPLLTQGFEGNFPPVGWSTDYTGAGFVHLDDSDPVIHQVHSGNYSAAHLYVASPQDDYLITPLISIPATNSSTLTFWQNNVYTSYYDIHEVVVSTDMTTWTTIYEETPTAANVWEKIYVSLSAYVGQDIYIGFHYVGNDADNWYIDDVEVLYDYEGPTVVDLVGNEALYPVVGAFLNNDMPVSVTVNDISGVQSVLGHYSFDEGITVVDLPFVKAKGGDEVWTAVIPQLAAVDSGYITFDMTDIGGIVNIDPTEYRIDFVLDTDAPVFNYVKGTMAYINNPMNLEVSFSDESAITSCSGFFSKDGGTTWTPFVMDPAKIHDYTYTGTIAAETAELLDGQVYFGMRDVEDNVSYSSVFTVKWMDGQDSYIEDFEFGAGNWTLTGNWAIVAEGEYSSFDHALTESPGGDYNADEVDSYAQWATPMDFTAYPGAEISFWTKYDIEEDFDYMYFEGSMDGGTTWIRLQTYSMEGVGWHQEVIPMNAFAGMSNVTFRFLFESDGGYEANGMYIDDLIISTYNVDHGAPTLITEPYGPKYYEGVFGDYTDAIEIIDFSGVASAIVYYTVDGGAEQSVTASNTSGNFYEFTIPTQAAGSQVEYRIYAMDGSAQMNEAYSPYYSYIAGDHMIYDSGYVDYYMTVEDGEAKAVRVTVPGSDESKTIMTGKLSYLLLRTYEDTTHISGDMEVHVWDDNAGVPGTELVAPFIVTSEGLAMTRVDMRSYDLNVSGDFWVGVAAPSGTSDIIYMTMERATMSADSAYGRSYDGVWNSGTSAWEWSQVPNDNWEFRAVLNGIYTGIEDESVPMATELQQNYPNPFNPTTTINFNLANDAKVSLVVYDVMGREVANLVNGEMVKGSHKVSFDASRLVSGVYYYNLKAAGVNQTKKMMLIK
ncbi:MAG: hypothetical protein A2Y39_05455 [Candidatus Delongbacteria bacterium GWF2_40_14]|nr:MAG: hypothetical protein A2Y39_05455 [Candidatus Delongbacteria bacterium GWF2_40_14]